MDKPYTPEEEREELYPKEYYEQNEDEDQKWIEAMNKRLAEQGISIF